jgi:hypothetical protein
MMLNDSGKSWIRDIQAQTHTGDVPGNLQPAVSEKLPDRIPTAKHNLQTMFPDPINHPPRSRCGVITMLPAIKNGDFG